MFPFQNVRSGQRELMNDIKRVVENSLHLIADAPTGIGKTVGALVPALEFAIDNGKTVFFITPKHSQHRIVIETVKKINESGYFIKAADIIGKKWLCAVPNVEDLSTTEFYEYCRIQVKNNKCAFYKRTKNKNMLTKAAHTVISKLVKDSVFHAEDIKSFCKNLCPYEITISLARDCSVIVSDYFHIFSPIGTQILSKLDKTFEDIIIIVDEAHNLPGRIRSLLSSRLSTRSLSYALKEDREFELGVGRYIRILEDVIKNIFHGKEELVERDVFISMVEEFEPYDVMVNEMEESSEAVMEEKKRSFIGSIANFLTMWTNTGDGFVRYIEPVEGRKSDYIALNYKCLDPSMISKPIIEASHSVILMSGTLKPMEMYRDILGMEDERTLCRSYLSPFSEKNRLDIILNNVTTKYTERNEKMYEKIGTEIEKLLKLIPGNVAVFFPSYELRDKIYRFIRTQKIQLFESRLMNKSKKVELYKKFASAARTSNGAVLYGVQGASFAEGVDYPGRILNSVIVVGLALDRPSLETEALIRYYDKKFGKGEDYAYTFPAIQKALQAAGRCIRSEDDKGICVFMDKRFTWPKYRKLLGIKAIPTFQPWIHIENFVQSSFKSF